MKPAQLNLPSKLKSLPPTIDFMWLARPLQTRLVQPKPLKKKPQRDPTAYYYLPAGLLTATLLLMIAGAPGSVIAGFRAVTIGYIMVVFMAHYFMSKAMPYRVDVETLDQRFAIKNKLTNLTADTQPKYKGSLFNVGYNRRRNYAFAGLRDGQLFEFGHYNYTEGIPIDDDLETDYVYAYVRFKIPKKLPHIMIDARANNILLEDMPGWISGAKNVVLEGDFPDNFHIYTRPENANQIPYIFTPDLMVQVLECSRDYDIEIFDDEVYMYVPDISFNDAKGFKLLVDAGLALQSALTHRSRYFKD